VSVPPAASHHPNLPSPVAAPRVRAAVLPAKSTAVTTQTRRVAALRTSTRLAFGKFWRSHRPRVVTRRADRQPLPLTRVGRVGEDPSGALCFVCGSDAAPIGDFWDDSGLLCYADRVAQQSPRPAGGELAQC